MTTDAASIQGSETSFSVADLIARFDEIELWRTIPDWPGYEVSSWGKVRRRNRVLRPASVAKYPFITLSCRQKRKSARIHHLVAAAFLGPPPFEGAIVAHNDGDTSNAKASNLRWASARENQHDRARHNTHCHGSRVFGAKLKEAQIPVIRQRIAAGERYRDIGADYGVSIHTIHLIKKNRIWKQARGAAWPVSANAGARA
ncbi:HNH endonuclease [Methylorubrum thiocyanatum]|uniref:HNH endonuclease n=1 Tax=Methylorubrum thiocyanatum TaxID=47958 RepID=UPI0035C7A275